MTADEYRRKGFEAQRQAALATDPLIKTDGNYWAVNGLRWQSRSNGSSGVTAPPFLAEEWW